MVVQVSRQVKPAVPFIQGHQKASSSITPEKSQLPHCSTGLFSLLNEHNYIQKGKITKAINLPSCSAIQLITLFDLIELPFNLDDHNNVTVLKDLSGKIVLELLLSNPLASKSNIVLETHLSGSAVTTIIESDLEWMKSLIRSFVAEEHYSSIAPHIKPFPKRKLPDIDIHIYCKKGSFKTRREILDQLLISLAEITLRDNLA